MAEAKSDSSFVNLSWVDVDESSDFPLQNLPYGVFKNLKTNECHCAVAIGDFAFDLTLASREGLFKGTSYGDTFLSSNLNRFMALTRKEWSEARARITALLSKDNDEISSNATLKGKLLINRPDNESFAMCLPCTIGDYTDFYSSRNHATNVGIMFRGKDNALQPNWTELPVGYHGRASSVVVSGTDIRRPNGQQVPNESSNGRPRFGSCKLMDFELELGFLIGGPPNKMGDPIPVEKTYENLFGVVLMNDWSARDIQKWEYVPLGPFNGKNFATTISPWVIPFEALEPFRVPLPTQDPVPLKYLQWKEDVLYNIDLAISIQGKDMKEPQIVSRTNATGLYWTFAQQLAHHTVTGCPFRPGDLCGTGTISGTTSESYGSMLEISWKGTKPLKMDDGSSRKFLLDGDTVNMIGKMQGKGYSMGFGDCKGLILPAHDLSKL